MAQADSTHDRDRPRDEEAGRDRDRTQPPFRVGQLLQSVANDVRSATRRVDGRSR